MEETSTSIAEVPISWRVHPARQRIGAAFVASAAILGLALLAALLMQSGWWGVFAAFVLFAALNRFFLPSEFSIDDEGVAARCGWSRRKCRWPDIRRFLHDARGGYISTRSRASALDSFSGIHLIFGDDRDTVVARIDRCLRARDAQKCSG
jgi:hypothetical protein